MAVRIGMKKMGRKHRPYFRIVAIDARQPRDGRVIEELGFYDPLMPITDPRHLRLNRGSPSGMPLPPTEMYRTNLIWSAFLIAAYFSASGSGTPLIHGHVSLVCWSTYEAIPVHEPGVGAA
jgi:ribosomal protein S16